MDMKEAEAILNEQPKDQKSGINLDNLITQSGNSSGFDTVKIGDKTFKVPSKYLIGNGNYQDKNGKYAVANGLNGDKQTLRFDRSNSPCTVVKTLEGHEFSIKADTLKSNLSRLSANNL